MVHELHGYWSTCGSAAKQSAIFIVREGTCEIRCLEQHTMLSVSAISDIHVSDRLGRLERKITLGDGSVFVTDDHEGVDKALTYNRFFSRYMHILETKWTWMLTGIGLCIFTLVVGFTYGLPWVSRHMASVLPLPVSMFLGERALTFLDKDTLTPSKLDKIQRQAIRQQLQDQVFNQLDFAPLVPLSIHFRVWNEDEQPIANAFALPSGAIILTDHLIGLLRHENELNAVVLHEIGHIKNKHGEQAVISASMLSLLAMLVFNDQSALLEMGVGLGAFLLSNCYSHTHEMQADRYALEQLVLHHKNPQHLSDALKRLAHNNKQTEDSAAETIEKTAQKEQSAHWFDYVSSHPSDKVRYEQIQRFKLCFQQNKTACD